VPLSRSTGDPATRPDASKMSTVRVRSRAGCTPRPPRWTRPRSPGRPGSGAGSLSSSAGPVWAPFLRFGLAAEAVAARPGNGPGKRHRQTSRPDRAFNLFCRMKCRKLAAGSRRARARPTPHPTERSGDPISTSFCRCRHGPERQVWTPVPGQNDDDHSGKGTPSCAATQTPSGCLRTWIADP
jgi:hypothetical protein